MKQSLTHHTERRTVNPVTSSFQEETDSVRCDELKLFDVCVSFTDQMRMDCAAACSAHVQCTRYPMRALFFSLAVFVSFGN